MRTKPARGCWRGKMGICFLGWEMEFGVLGPGFPNRNNRKLEWNKEFAPFHGIMVNYRNLGNEIAFRTLQLARGEFNFLRKFNDLQSVLC
jgi:hypothetical protein